VRHTWQLPKAFWHKAIGGKHYDRYYKN